MRKALATQIGERRKFSAVFIRIGKKISYKGYSEDTILLKNVTDMETHKVVTDHLWFTFSKAFEKIELVEGVCIEFEARIKEYRKGYVNNLYGIDKSAIDFKLSHPTKIKPIRT